MTSASGYAGRDEADDEALDALQRDDALHDASRLVVGGLIGVALGAGLGWLASRSFAGRPAEDARADESVRRRVDVERHVQRGLPGLRRAGRNAARRVG